MALSMKRGHKQVDLAMISMARFCAVYAVYCKGRMQTQGSYESSLRVPLMEFAQSRGWMHILEYKLPKSRIAAVGSFKKVDLVLMYGRQVVGVECKFPNEENIANYKQTDDHDKLRDHFVKDEFVTKFPWIYGYLLTVAEVKAFGKIPINKFVSKGNIHDNSWLNRQGKKINVLDVGHGFKCEVFAGKWRYVAQIDKVLEIRK